MGVGAGVVGLCYLIESGLLSITHHVERGVGGGGCAPIFRAGTIEDDDHDLPQERDPDEPLRSQTWEKSDKNVITRYCRNKSANKDVSPRAAKSGLRWEE